jgi:hypothetical protein
MGAFPAELSYMHEYLLEASGVRMDKILLGK